jgi:hypothetical protein
VCNTILNSLDNVEFAVLAEIHARLDLSNGLQKWAIWMQAGDRSELTVVAFGIDGDAVAIVDHRSSCATLQTKYVACGKSGRQQRQQEPNAWQCSARSWRSTLNGKRAIGGIRVQSVGLEPRPQNG